LFAYDTYGQLGAGATNLFCLEKLQACFDVD
jgi:hypothetical protein